MTGLLVKLVMQGLILSMIPTHCPPVGGIGQTWQARLVLYGLLVTPAFILVTYPLPLACPGTGALHSGLTHRLVKVNHVSLNSLCHGLLPASIVWPQQPGHHVLQCDHLLLIEMEL